MPNLTQATITMAEQFKEMLDAIMEAKDDEARQEAYEAFTQHKIVEKQLRIAEKMEPTKKGASKVEVCPHCNCVTTNLKQHTKTLKCHEIHEVKWITHLAKTTEIEKTDVIMYRAVESAGERKADLTNMEDDAWKERTEKIKEFYEYENLCQKTESKKAVAYVADFKPTDVEGRVDEMPVVDAPVVDAPVVEMPTPVAETAKPPKKKLKLKLKVVS